MFQVCIANAVESTRPYIWYSADEMNIILSILYLQQGPVPSLSFWIGKKPLLNI